MFALSPKAEDLRHKLIAFMDEHIYPNEAEMAKQHQALDNKWSHPALLDELKEKARAEGLWNLFMPHGDYGAGLSNLDYAQLCEIMGRSPIGPGSL